MLPWVRRNRGLFSLAFGILAAIWPIIQASKAIYEHFKPDNLVVSGVTTPNYAFKVERLPQDFDAKSKGYDHWTTLAINNMSSLNKPETDVSVRIPRRGYALVLTEDNRLLYSGDSDGKVPIKTIAADTGVYVHFWHNERLGLAEHITVMSQETNQINVPVADEADPNSAYRWMFWTLLVIFIFFGAYAMYKRFGPAAEQPKPKTPRATKKGEKVQEPGSSTQPT